MSMKTKIISKNDLPEWDYGDVVIKKFSFGDKLKLSSFTTETSLDVTKDEHGKDIEKINRKSKIIDAYEITMFTIASGLHSIKDDKDYEYVLKPHSHVDEKLKFVKINDIPYEAGKVLLEHIKDFNAEISEDKKKD